MNTSTRSIVILVVAGISGLLFGAGLTLSEMVNPARVLGFLDLAGRWDPTLAFVMGGALLVSIPGYQIVLRMRKPVVAEQFGLPQKTVLDRQLLGGATLFGIGWGLVGLCPGPAVAALSTLDIRVMAFVVAMLAGFLTHRQLFE